MSGRTLDRHQSCEYGVAPGNIWAQSKPGKRDRDKWGRGKGYNSLQPRNYCPIIAPTIARIVALRATIGAIVGAIVGAMVGAIVSRLQTIATFAAAPLVAAPLPRLTHCCQGLLVYLGIT